MLNGQLGLDVEGAYGVNLVVEEVYAERVVIAVGEDVDNATPDGILPRLIDIVLHAESESLQLFLKFCKRYLLALAEGDVAAVELLLADDQFGESSRVGDNLQRSLF